MTAPSLKQKLGCWVHERWYTELVLRLPRLARASGITWLDLCNRNEELSVESITGGRICRWCGSSSLTVVRLFPDVGVRLLRHVLAEWPIEFNESPERVTAVVPEVSVLIPVSRGSHAPLLKLTLASIRAQQNASFEIVVVEQGPQAEIGAEISPDVRYIFARGHASQAFNKSWALNIAARAARGRYLAIHDADFLVPTRYLATSMEMLKSVDGARPARLIACLDPATTQQWLSRRSTLGETRLERMVANNPTPIVVRRDAYWAVGGHDESYFGWGGEDDEFLSRVRTRPFLEAGLMPVVHLWHQPATKKTSGDRNHAVHDRLLSTSAQDRMRRLKLHTLGGDQPQGCVPA